MSCSNQACMNRECLNWSSILHFVSCTYFLFATTSWHFVSLYWEGKVLWTTQVTMLAGWLPFYFLHGRYLTSPKMKNSKVKKDTVRNSALFEEHLCLHWTNVLPFQNCIWNMKHGSWCHEPWQQNWKSYTSSPHVHHSFSLQELCKCFLTPASPVSFTSPAIQGIKNPDELIN